MTVAARSGCVLCDRAACSPTPYDIHSDHDWIVFANAEQGRSGAVWVLARVHADGLWDLSDAQAASLGPMVRSVASAMRAVLGASHVYMATFGERFAHVHLLMISRDDSAPSTLRGVQLLAAHLVDEVPAEDEVASFARCLREGFTAPS